MLPATLQFLIVMIASAMNDRLQRKLDYVEEERRILGNRSMPSPVGEDSFTAHQRRRLAEAGKLLRPEERPSAAARQAGDDSGVVSPVGREEIR